MQKKKFKTRKQLAEELGISDSTLYRWIRERKIELPKGLVSPTDERKIKVELGFLSDDQKD